MFKEMLCKICNAATTLTCTDCKAVYYCSKEHQKLHWRAVHKRECVPYKIVNNDVLGWHLVAKRAIQYGDLVLRESPIAFGPKMHSAPVCLACHRYITVSEPDRDYYKCSQCNWPMCNRECETAAIHEDECRFLRKKKFVPKSDAEGSVEADNVTLNKDHAYCVILPLRVILLKEKDPIKFQKFTMLHDHLEEWIQKPLYQFYKSYLVKLLRLLVNLDDWSDEDILRIVGRLDTNSFEIPHLHTISPIDSIYYVASMFSHNCIPNTERAFDEDFNIVFIAKKPIRKGEIISVSHTYLLYPTFFRQCHLMQTKHFICKCRRCLDPSELGTYIGSIRCRKCFVGRMVSTNPLNQSADFKCNLCKYKVPSTEIIRLYLSLHKEISGLDRKTPRGFESFLIRYKNILHPKNSFMLTAKYILIKFYSNSPGYCLDEMNNATMSWKIAVTHELLIVGKTLEDGGSVFRGSLLVELQECLCLQAKRQFATKRISLDVFDRQIEKGLNFLKESVDINKYIAPLYKILYARSQKFSLELDNKVCPINSSDEN